VYAKIHSIFFVSEDNDVYALGNNQLGQLGVSDKDFVNEVTFLPELNAIKKIILGSTRTFFIRDDGKVFVCGSQKFGELGLLDKQHCQITMITNLPAIKDIFIDDKHTFFLAENGAV